MSFDSGSFDPNKVGGNYKQNQGGKKNADQGQPQDAQPQAGDPYAELKIDPSKVLDLLSAHGKANLPAELQNPSITASVRDFENAVNPADHARLGQAIKEAIHQEFGNVPTDELVQEVLDDYLIGRPVVTA